MCLRSSRREMTLSTVPSTTPSAMRTSSSNFSASTTVADVLNAASKPVPSKAATRASFSLLIANAFDSNGRKLSQTVRMKNEMNMPALQTKGALQSNICGEKTITCCKLSQDQSETPKPITLAVNDQDI